MSEQPSAAVADAPGWPFSPLLAMGTGPRHYRVGSTYGAAQLGDPGRAARLKVMTWTGCNGQTCARDCGPGHSAVLWVPCNFAVGHGHHYTLSDGEIAGLRDVLGRMP